MSPDFHLQQQIQEASARGAQRQSANDERAAAEAANRRGLTGQDAERFKAAYVANVSAARADVKRHVSTVLNSPQGQARPSAALAVALRDGLTTDQAIAVLESMPAEVSEADALAAEIINAGG